MAKIIPIIVCGGNGTRLLPFLRDELPKQFLSILKGSSNLLQNTLLRFSNKNIFHEPIIVTNFNYREQVLKSLQEISFTAQAIIWEPEGRNTGPALAALISYLDQLKLDPETVITLVPIDHYLEDSKIFVKTLSQVEKFLLNNSNKIVTLSVAMTDFEKNYGHLMKGKKLAQNYYEVKDFVEKPEKELEGYNLCWNSGIYSMSIKGALNLLEKQVPFLLDNCRKAVKRASEAFRVCSTIEREILLNHEDFAKNSTISLDQILTLPYKAGTLVCTELGTKWEDIGLWTGIQRLEKAKNTIINREIFLEQFNLID